MLPPFLTIGLVLAGALLSAWAAGLVAKLGLLPNAVEGRSNHLVPTSRAGGLAFCAGLIVAFDIGAVVIGVSSEALFLFALSLAAAALGMLDDARGLGAMPKLLVLGLIAVLTALTAGGVPSLPLPVLGYVPLPGWLGVLLGAIWVLGFVNVFNFLDGLNGMAAATGLVLLCAIGSLALLSESLSLYLLILSATGALFGFAAQNILRGKPFLGDAGSLSLGVLIAGGALSAGNAGPAGAAVFWLAALGAIPFVADAVFTLIARARAGERLTEAHSRHVYQRLKRQGRSHEAVAAVYGALAAFGALGIFVLGTAAPASWLLGWAAATLVLWLVVTQLLLRRGPQDSRTAEDTASDSSVSRRGEDGSTVKADAALSA